MQTQPNLKHILQSTKFNPNKILGLFSANSPQTLQTSIPQSPQISINKIPNKSNELLVGLYPFKGYAGNFELISSPVTKSTKHTFTPLCFFVILIQRFFSCNEGLGISMTLFLFKNVDFKVPININFWLLGMR